MAQFTGQHSQSNQMRKYLRSNITSRQVSRDLQTLLTSCFTMNYSIWTAISMKHIFTLQVEHTDLRLIKITSQSCFVRNVSTFNGKAKILPKKKICCLFSCKLFTIYKDFCCCFKGILLVILMEKVGYLSKTC